MAAGDAGGRTGGLARLLAPLCVVSGGVVLSGFFFPQFVGEAVTGEAWLVVSLAFFGSGLGYLAVLPYGGREGDDGPSSPLAVGRPSVRRALASFAGRQDPLILGVPVVAFAAFFALQAAFPASTTGTANALSGAVLREAGWLLSAAVLVAVGYCAFLLVGPWGDVRLGDPDEGPAYTYPTYFTLVFTAGIAAGLVFWGPAEALFHYRSPPPYLDVAPRSDAAVTGALTYALFHWGVSAWSAYAVVGVPIAYFVFVRGAPLRVSTVLAPFVGVSGLDGWLPRSVDALAVVATIGGVATSVALVSEQFLSGIGYGWDVAVGAAGPILFVGGLTGVFVLSSVTGIHRGIRRIAGLNVVLFVAFGGLLALLGPRGFVADVGARALGRYVVEFVPLSLYGGGAWVVDWTVWNWSWWFSWAPFAGLFVAALSRGRRIRTVVFTTVVATAAATAVWFLLLGGTSLFVQHAGRADLLAAVAARDGSEAVAGFPLFAALPLGDLLLFSFLALIVVFTTTSADTSTLVVSILAADRGTAPTRGTIAFWGVVQGVVAVAGLTVGGAETLQALSVLTGGPFALVTLVALAGFTRTLYRADAGRDAASLPGRVLARLPTIRLHHDVDPPGATDPGDPEATDEE